MAPDPSPWSLQRRVLVIAIVVMSLGVAVGSLSMYWAAAVMDDQIVDQRVEMLARGILKHVEEGGNDNPGNGAATDDQNHVMAFETGLHAYQVWTNYGATLLKNHNGPVGRSFLPTNFTGYKAINVDGTDYCAFSVASADRSLIVQVVEPTPERSVRLGLLMGEYLAAALVPLSLLLISIQITLNRSFRPFERISTNLARRSPTDGSPIEVEAPPMEVVPLVQSLNSHLQRQALALHKETRFTSVAAHEMRTPLAGIRAQAQIASLATTPNEMRSSLTAVMRGVDSTSRMIEQLIDLHHTETSGATDSWRSEVVNLSALHEQLWAEFRPKAELKQITLKIVFDIDEMHGYEFAIWMLARNLVINAIQYSPVKGRVEVRIKRRDFRVVLTVDDSGPGIPDHARDQAFEKFNRLGRGGGDGVGLGLSIVANVAELHQAVISLNDSPLGGLRVEVQFHGVDVPAHDGKDTPFRITRGASLWRASPP